MVSAIATALGLSASPGALQGDSSAFLSFSQVLFLNTSSESSRQESSSSVESPEIPGHPAVVVAAMICLAWLQHGV